MTLTLVTDYDLELRNSAGDLIASFNLPALTAGVWQCVEIDISSYVRSDIKYIKIQCDVADNDVIDLFNLCAYEYGNGSGPVDGLCGVYIATEAIVIGDYVSAIPGRAGYVKKGANNDTTIIGKCVRGGILGTKVLVQETGRVYLRSASTITIGDACSAASATTADGDTTAGRPFGTWMEATATAGADLLVELNTRGGVGTEVPVTQLGGYTRGDILRGGAADWEDYVAKTAGFILIGDGTDIISKQFDWDDVAAGAGADVAHDHSAAGEGGAIAITAIPGYVRGDVIRGGAAAWEAYVAKTAGFILIGDGTDIISKQFDWDDLAAGAGADMAHDHSAAGEGGAIAITAIPGYVRGDVIRGGAAAWEAYVAKTAGFILIGDGTDIISKQFDWDDVAAGAGADMVHDHSAAGEGGAIAITAIPGYTRGDIIKGGAAAWEDYVAKTAGFILVGDGTDLISKQFDWDDLAAGAGADMAHDHSAAGEGGEIPVASVGSYVQGDIIRGGAADWEAYVAKTAGFILEGNGTDIISKQFDWDDLSAGAGADMVHDHSAAGEGGEIPVASVGSYVQGDIIRGGAADWEAYVAKTAGFILEGNGTDIISKQFDWDDLSAGAGADMVHDHSAAGEGGNFLIKTDYQFSPDFLDGRAESGTWTPTFATSLPLVTRTSAQNTTQVFQIALPIPSRTTGSKGIEITSVEMAYSCDLADAGDDIKILVTKRAIPANGAAPGVISVVAGNNDGEYDANHNTSAKRVVDTGAPENHTLLMTVGTPAFIADGETWFLQIRVVEADDAAGALAIIIKDVIVNYTNDVN